MHYTNCFIYIVINSCQCINSVLIYFSSYFSFIQSTCIFFYTLHVYGILPFSITYIHQFPFQFSFLSNPLEAIYNPKYAPLHLRSHSMDSNCYRLFILFYLQLKSNPSFYILLFNLVTFSIYLSLPYNTQYIFLLSIQEHNTNTYIIYKQIPSEPYIKHTNKLTIIVFIYNIFVAYIGRPQIVG